MIDKYLNAKRKSGAALQICKQIMLFVILQRHMENFKEEVRLFIAHMRGMIKSTILGRRWLNMSRKWGPSMSFKMKNHTRNGMTKAVNLMQDQIREQSIHKLRAFLI